MKQFLITVGGVLVGLVLFVFLLPFVLIGMISASVKEAPAQPAQMVLSLDLREGMTDQRPQSPFAAFSDGHSLLDTLARIEAARTDGRVKGLYVRAATSGMPAAQAEEIRTALANFRRAGKFVIAHIQNDGVRMSMPGYMAVADADEVWLQGSSEFMPMGLSAEVTFLAGTLQRYHMLAQFETREEFKTAAATLTDRTFSPANRQETTELMGSLYDRMLANIAADRSITPQQARAAIDATPYTAQDALNRHLIDKIGRPEDAERAALSRANLQGQTLVEFAEYRPTARRSGPVIAVVQGEGAIVSGPEEHELFGDEEQMNSDVIARALLDASNDANVRAIIFRVSSPGGSVVASDQIRAALRTAKERGKKIVVSMGEVAASGGYYVSADADEIVAEPTTITGSIGVLGGKLIIGPASDYYLSTNTETISVGSPYVNMFSPNHPFSAAERAQFAGFIDRAYAEFIGIVANGRHMTTDQAHALAHGRVWTGQQAFERHLVDHLGGFDVALARAKALAQIGENDQVQLRMYPQQKNPFEAIERLFGVSADSAEALARMNAVLSDPRVVRALSAIREEDANVRARADNMEIR